MSRIKPVLETTHDGIRRSFNAIERQLGVVPNMMRTMAQSPRVLEGYLALSGALSRGLLPATLQEQIALAVAEINACNYCLSAHTALGRKAGLSDDQLAASREGRAAEAKANAALQFASAVLEHRGGVGDDELARVRAAGFSDAEIAEIIAHVALNALTNYFNRAADTEIDFPKVAAAQLV
ncbi:MAG: carboxymuconolactone decarboxylase family protein [Vicinamibacterales bacterium]